MISHNSFHPIENLKGKSLLDNVICFDLVYNPTKTPFLKHCSKLGGQIVEYGGLNMLLYQAGLSFSLWTSQKFPMEFVKKELMKYKIL